MGRYVNFPRAPGGAATPDATPHPVHAGYAPLCHLRSLTVALLNAIWLGLALLAGESPGRDLPWALVPAVIAGYLLAPAGHRALGPGRTGARLKVIDK